MIGLMWIIADLVESLVKVGLLVGVPYLCFRYVKPAPPAPPALPEPSREPLPRSRKQMDSWLK